jgi:hypothetical protein
MLEPQATIRASTWRALNLPDDAVHTKCFLNPDIWADDDYAIVDPDLNKRVGRIYPEMILASRSGCGSCRPEPAPPPNSGEADSLEEARVAFKRRYAEVKGRH